MKKLGLFVVCAGVVLLLFLMYVKFSKEAVRPTSPTIPGAVHREIPPPSSTQLPTDVVLAPDVRVIPGETLTWGLRYRDPAAKTVMVSGTWDGWTENTPMVKKRGQWVLDLRPLKLDFGRHDFKFLTDGIWEKGENRTLYINEEGFVERPSDVIFSAIQETPTRVDVSFRGDVKPTEHIRVHIRQVGGGEVPVVATRWEKGHGSSRVTGFSCSGDSVTFSMAADFYGLALDASDRVSVGGSFNGWNANAGSQWELQDADGDRVWTLSLSASAFGDDLEKAAHEFKFVVNGSQWLRAPISAPNAISDGKGNINLKLAPKLSSSTLLHVETAEALLLSKCYTLIVDGLRSRPAFHTIFPGGVLDALYSSKPLGATLDKQSNHTLFGVFAPRASAVELCIYDGPTFRSLKSGALIPPATVHAMRSDEDGVWEVRLPGLLTGTYYAFRIDGPSGPGESFDPKQPIGDPYARAVAHASNASIVMDPEETNAWFTGWTDQAHRLPPLEDVVIYETHVRDLTMHASSGVEVAERGRYAGVSASTGTGTGLDHLKALGINMIEFMPISEFENGTFGHSWGYGPAFYAAPEASYGSAPLEGSQYHEFKALVDDLHRKGFGVILDVVYNHVGTPNVFLGLDRKYYFRQDNEFVLSNFSGCGNDVRTEAPMMRRFIVDNVLYWMREHHVDGFRFDLAELIDMETLREIEKAARALNPDVLLISEPWSFRGDHKRKLKGTGWSAWNNEFRDPVKHFVAGHGDRAAVMRVIQGSVDLWTAHSLQSVNYLESHDDMCLTDELSTDPKHNGTHLTEELAAKSRLGATLLFTSLGVPMIAEGQEYLRSKLGLHNTFDRGDAVNALRWTDRDRPLAKLTQDYYAGLARLRGGAFGKAFKVGKSVPRDHYRWILPSEKHALGYRVNVERRFGNASFVVLVNASQRMVAFDVDFRDGNWIGIGDGRQIDEQGIPGMVLPPAGMGGECHVKVPKLSSQIFMRR